MGDKIVELVETMGGSRRSIYQAMRDEIASISPLHQHVPKDIILCQEDKVSTNDRSTQTTQQVQDTTAEKQTP